MEYNKEMEKGKELKEELPLTTLVDVEKGLEGLKNYSDDLIEKLEYILMQLKKDLPVDLNKSVKEDRKENTYFDFLLNYQTKIYYNFETLSNQIEYLNKLLGL